MIVIIILLFQVYHLDIKCYVNSRLWLWLWLYLQLFLPSSVGSALVKVVPLSATIPAFAFFLFLENWKDLFDI